MSTHFSRDWKEHLPELTTSRTSYFTCTVEMLFFIRPASFAQRQHRLGMYQEELKICRTTSHNATCSGNVNSLELIVFFFTVTVYAEEEWILTYKAPAGTCSPC